MYFDNKPRWVIVILVLKNNGVTEENPSINDTHADSKDDWH